jgi:hypothetical protein
VLFGEFGLFIHEGEDRTREEVGGSGAQRGKPPKKPTADLIPFFVCFGVTRRHIVIVAHATLVLRCLAAVSDLPRLSNSKTETATDKGKSGKSSLKEFKARSRPHHG